MADSPTALELAADAAALLMQGLPSDTGFLVVIVTDDDSPAMSTTCKSDAATVRILQNCQRQLTEGPTADETLAHIRRIYRGAESPAQGWLDLSPYLLLDE